MVTTRRTPSLASVDMIDFPSVLDESFFVGSQDTESSEVAVAAALDNEDAGSRATKPGEVCPVVAPPPTSKRLMRRQTKRTFAAVAATAIGSPSASPPMKRKSKGKDPASNEGPDEHGLLPVASNRAVDAVPVLEQNIKHVAGTLHRVEEALHEGLGAMRTTLDRALDTVPSLVGQHIRAAEPPTRGMLLGPCLNESS